MSVSHRLHQGSYMSKRKKLNLEAQVVRELTHMFRRRAISLMKEKGIEFQNAPSNQQLISWVGYNFPIEAGTIISKKERLKFWIAAMGDNPGKLRPRKADGRASKNNSDFYLSREWRALRFDVLKANDGRCELCGAGKHDGIRLHVDHIKPRSKFPHLSLVASNLQVLCEDCNMGKSNRDDTDWREPRFIGDEWSAIRERLGEA